MMDAATTNLIEECTGCGLPLPLRPPRPGEAASSWVCSYCTTRFYAVLLEDSPPEVLGNIEPDRDVNPSLVLGGEILARMHKRSGQVGRVFDERQSERRPAEFSLSITTGRDEIRVQTQDVSAGGFSFLSDRAIEPWTIVTARFLSLPGAPITRGIIRNCEKSGGDGYRIGAEFAPLADGSLNPDGSS